MKSVIESLGGDKFPRLKIGVGGSGGREQMIDHVLGHFKEEEREVGYGKHDHPELGGGNGQPEPGFLAR